MGKPFCICENKGADQLHGPVTAQHLFSLQSTAPLLPKSEISSLYPIICCCTARFVSDLVGNPKDRFSYVVAQIRAKRDPREMPTKYENI